MDRLVSCITPQGTFQYGIHKPQYTVTNLRQDTSVDTLGSTPENEPVLNTANLPAKEINVDSADWIYEIPNAFSFRGRTFIDKEWADSSANNPERIQIPAPPKVSLSQIFSENGVDDSVLENLPESLLLALATTSTDEKDLVKLATLSCDFVDLGNGNLGLYYQKDDRGRMRARIKNHLLFEAVANSPHLPDRYKIAMVIRPGAQGSSEIVGEWPKSKNSHIYEYLRKNSYIAGGHYAANMAEDAIRYSIHDLQSEDMEGLRHLYYQRSYVRLAEELGLSLTATNRRLSKDELENLRQNIATHPRIANISMATLWGWNFGFDYAPTKYRLHASHQQIHQQFAMVPGEVDGYNEGSLHPSGSMPAYGCGDLIEDCILRYKKQYDSDLFSDYLKAIQNNKRMDERADLPSELVVWKNERVMLFVPKAQTSQWELQLICLPDSTGKTAGNIFECDSTQRNSLDTGILKAQKALAGLGAKMVTSIEYPKRLGIQAGFHQPLLYAFLPRLPESPGAFSEAQLRFINGHYPEDFAAVCRKQLK